MKQNKYYLIYYENFIVKERSRQSARECRARKKLRYQYLDDIILERERANIRLREELLRYQVLSIDLPRVTVGPQVKLPWCSFAYW